VVVMLAALALTCVMVAAAAYNTRPASETETAAGERMLTRQQQLNEAEYQVCLQDPEEYLVGTAGVEDCESLRPELEWYLPRPALDLAGEVSGRGRVLLVSLAGMAVLVGAFFAGRDWTTRWLSAQLLHEPRRLRVWTSKALAVVIGTTVVSGLLLAAFWGILAGFAAARGVEVPEEAWRLVLETSGRGLVLVAAVALGSFALTMGFRHALATLGLLFGYAVVGEGLAASLPFDRMSQWSLANNVLAWLHDGVEVRDRTICGAAADACSPTYILTAAHAAAYLGGLLVVAVLLSLLLFSRRDVP
jgi:hypothetical protein